MIWIIIMLKSFDIAGGSKDINKAFSGISGHEENIVFFRLYRNNLSPRASV